MQRDTNMVALMLHEKSKKHQLAVPQETEALVPADAGPVAQNCAGIDLMTMNGQDTPGESLCGKMRHGFLHWAMLGCPDVLSNKTSPHVRVTAENSVIVQDAQCRAKGGFCDRDRGCCQRCGRLPYSQPFAQSVAKMLYRISLVDLMTLAMQNKRDEMKSFWDSVQKSPWARHTSYDLSDELADFTFLQLLRRCQQVVGGVDKSARNPAFNAWVEARLSWVTPGNLPKPGGADKVQECALDLLDETAALNGRLSQMIKNGVLEADPAARVLVAALVQKADKLARGCKRVGSSSVAGVDEHLLHQLLFKLWRGMSRAEALRTFGVSKKAVNAKKMLQLDFLPSFFCPSLDTLRRNCSLVLGHLRVMDTRDYMLLWDDTVTRAFSSGWICDVLLKIYSMRRSARAGTFVSHGQLEVFAQDYSLMYGIRDTAVIIGGADPDCSCIVPSEDGGFPELDKATLAQVTLSFLVKRLDRRAGTWDVRMCPRRLSQITGASQLQLCGEALQALSESNGDRPPMLLAYDNYPSHQLINSIMLGANVDLEGVPFWQHGKVGRPLPVLMFPFRPFLYKELPMFASNDAAHVMKAVAGNLRRACRVVHLGSNILWSNINVLRCHGLSPAAFVGRDCQSDKQAAELLTPRGPPQWDSLGITIFQFTTSLILGSFTAARLFEPQEIFVNCLSGYYLCLYTIAFASAWQANIGTGELWQRLLAGIFSALQRTVFCVCHRGLQGVKLHSSCSMALKMRQSTISRAPNAGVKVLLL